MSNNSTNNIESSSSNTINQNNRPDFKELVNRSLDESNNQILLYAMDTKSGNTNLVIVPL